MSKPRHPHATLIRLNDVMYFVGISQLGVSVFGMIALFLDVTTLEIAGTVFFAALMTGSVVLLRSRPDFFEVRAAKGGITDDASA
jgi:formate/nitrite transporter FocA (FNT family)